MNMKGEEAKRRGTMFAPAVISVICAPNSVDLNSSAPPHSHSLVDGFSSNSSLQTQTLFSDITLCRV